MEVYRLKDLGLRVFWDKPAEPEDALADVIHHHGFCELHILLENSCTIQVGSSSLTVGEGQFCLIAPHVNHATHSPAQSFRRLILTFEEEKDAPALGHFLTRWVAERPVYVGENPMLPLLAGRLEDRKGEFSREYTRAVLGLMLAELARSLSTRQDCTAPAATADEARTMVMDDFLNRHFPENGSQEKLAAALGLSRRQLDRVMHSRYGMGYQEKISQIRLEVACDLLRRTRLSVQSVAERVGYSTAANFSAFFRKHKGQTPTEYRKSLQM